MNKINDRVSIHEDLSSDVRNRIVNAINLNLDSQVLRLFTDLHYADQADVINHLNHEQREILTEILGPKFNPLILPELSGEVREDILNLLDTSDLAHSISKLDTDEVVDIIEDLEKRGRKELLDAIKSEKKRIEIEEALSYPEDSVGRIMVPVKNFVAIEKDLTVGEAIERIQKKKNFPDDFRDIIVVDDFNRPISTVSIGQLIRSNNEKKVSSIMADPDELKVLRTYMDQAEAARLFSKYALNLSPVINDRGELVGAVLVSDIIDVINEEAEEDILHLGNVTETDVFSSVFYAARSRFPWLVTSLLTTILGAGVIEYFSDTVEKVVVLAALMPVIAGLGGIAGTQTLTVMVRGIATKEVTKRNSLKVVFKEALMGLVNGIFMGIITAIAVFVWKHNITLSFVLGTTIVFTLTTAGFIGSGIPIILEKMKFDPATSSSAFLTATLDALAFLVFLSLATAFIINV